MLEPSVFGNIAIPFMLAAGTVQPKFSLQRVLEALLIAVISAVGASYMTVQKLEIKQEAIQDQFNKQVERRNLEVNGIKSDLRSSEQKRDLQYEVLRSELQKIALVVERQKK
jgi:hypothetical protein